MTIHELEERTGLERSGIRFYEREGFLTPKRLENGYRDYSEQDCEVLLKIRLLRKVQFSLDEIRSAMRGDASVSALAQQKLSQFEKQSQELEASRSVCRMLRDDNASFDSLNTERYLRALEDRSGQQGPSVPAEDAASGVYQPWRRYFARALDDALLAFVSRTFLVLIAHLPPDGALTLTLTALLTMGLQLVLEPFLLHLTGTTPGKALLGLRILSRSGGTLSFSAAFSRTAGVMTYGLCWNIPVLSQIFLIRSLRACRREEWMEWELSDEVYTAQTPGAGHIIALALSVLLLITGNETVHRVSMLPPNRGELTKKEWTENFRYLRSQLGKDSWLSEDGSWVYEQPTGNSVVIQVIDPAEVSLQSDADGILRSITLHTQNFTTAVAEFPFEVSDLCRVCLLSQPGAFTKYREIDTLCAQISQASQNASPNLPESQWSLLGVQMELQCRCWEDDGPHMDLTLLIRLPD